MKTPPIDSVLTYLATKDTNSSHSWVMYNCCDFSLAFLPNETALNVLEDLHKMKY